MRTALLGSYGTQEPSFLWPSPPETLPPSLRQASWAAGPLSFCDEYPRVTFVYQLLLLDYPELYVVTPPEVFSNILMVLVPHNSCLSRGQYPQTPRIKSDMTSASAQDDDGPPDYPSTPKQQQRETEYETQWFPDLLDIRQGKEVDFEWWKTDEVCPILVSACCLESSSVRWRGPSETQQTQN